MEKAKRYNKGKVQYSYLLEFPSALAEVAKVSTAGAEKYSRGNWQLGGKPDTEYLDSALRHMFKYAYENVLDDECGTHHLAHAVWNLLALMELNYFQTYGTGYDPIQEEMEADRGTTNTFSPEHY